MVVEVDDVLLCFEGDVVCGGFLLVVVVDEVLICIVEEVIWGGGVIEVEIDEVFICFVGEVGCDGIVMLVEVEEVLIFFKGDVGCVGVVIVEIVVEVLWGLVVIFELVEELVFLNFEELGIEVGFLDFWIIWLFVFLLFMGFNVVINWFCYCKIYNLYYLIVLL